MPNLKTLNKGKKYLIVIGHPDKKSFCWNGIYKTMIRQMRKHKVNYRTIDLYSDSFARPRTKLVENIKNGLLGLHIYALFLQFGGLD